MNKTLNDYLAAHPDALNGRCGASFAAGFAAGQDAALAEPERLDPVLHQLDQAIIRRIIRKNTQSVLRLRMQLRCAAEAFEELSARYQSLRVTDRAERYAILARRCRQVLEAHPA